MDIKEILIKQKELDLAIKKTHCPNNDDLKTKMKIGLFVEIGEFANEIQAFKYWKKNKIIDNNLIIEEFSDGLHFLLSFALNYDFNSTKISPKIISDDINQQFLATFSKLNVYYEREQFNILWEVLELYLGIIKLLKFSDQEIIDGYLRKNQKNFERIKNNY
ncbi:MAG: dUTP diphosphatase [Metamycoplasmataceae bacterium]